MRFGRVVFGVVRNEANGFAGWRGVRSGLGRGNWFCFGSERGDFCFVHLLFAGLGGGLAFLRFEAMFFFCLLGAELQ